MHSSIPGSSSPEAGLAAHLPGQAAQPRVASPPGETAPTLAGAAGRPSAFAGWLPRLGAVILAGLAGVAVLAEVLAAEGPWATVAHPFQPPSLSHPFGTDDLGRDLLAGVVHGARTSLMVGLIVAGIATPIGVVLGGAAAYFGGLWDDALMRFTEFFQVMPRFFLALVAVALFGPGLTTLTVVLGLTSWTLTARLLRAQVLSLRGRDYVVAAHALGAGAPAILWRHILPNALAPVIVHTALLVGQVILTEASLAFIGLGDPDHISWGYLLSNAQPFLRRAWWLAFFPGLSIALAVLGFNLVGDGLNRRYSIRWMARQPPGHESRTSRSTPSS